MIETRERRLVPRYRYSTEVTVSRTDQRRFSASTTDVSAHGMGLLMPREAVVALGGPESQLLTPGDHFDLVLSQNVVAADGVIGPTLAARVRHVRRISRDQYHVGVVFGELDRREAGALGQILSEARERLR
jgi:hypothetical protein